MKRKAGLAIICIVVAVSVASLAVAAEYMVYVKRLESNVYQDLDSRAIIKTSLCLELALGDKAILIWNGTNHYDCGKLVFIDSGRTCQVDGVYK